MRKIMGTLLGVCMLSACGSNSGNSGKLGANIKLYNPEDVARFVEMQMVSKSDALDSIKMLQKSMATSYIGYNVKKELIGKSGDEIFSECTKGIEQGPDRLSTFKMYDHVLECLAGFQDTHMSMEKLVSSGMVSTGIAISTIIGGKVYISGVRPNLIKKIEEVQKLEPDSLSAKLAVGNEIVSVDGVPVLSAIANLQKYVNSSTADAGAEEAAGNLFTRDFSYPEKSEIALKIKNSGGDIIDVTLPWILNTNAPSSLESRSALVGRGIVSPEKYFGPDKALLSRKEFDKSEPLFKDLTAKRTFNDKDDNPKMTFGLKTINNKTSCYMQLNTFTIEKDKTLGFKLFETINESAQPVSFNENVKNFLKSCESFGAPFILDMRVNGGGNPDIAEILYEYFETEKTPQTYRVINMLNNTGNLAYLSGSQNEADKDAENLESLLILESLKNSFDKKTPLSDWVALKKTHEKSIFTGPLTVLTSPACVSACDGFLNRIKTSGRGKIYGTHTNGTGFGFSETDLSTNDFQDHLKLYTVRLPNRSFQNTLVASDKDFSVEKDLKGSVIPLEKIQIIENRPAQPDTVIEYTLKDIKENYADYIEKLSKLLN